MNAVQELARLYGVADAYVDYRAQPREVSLQSQAAILAAIGVDAADEQAAAAAIHQHETVRWTKLLPIRSCAGWSRRTSSRWACR